MGRSTKGDVARRREIVAELYFAQKRSVREITRAVQEEGLPASARVIQADITALLKEYQKTHKNESERKIALYKQRLESLYGMAISKEAIKQATEITNIQLKIEGAYDKVEEAAKQPEVILLKEADQSSRKLLVVPDDGESNE